MTDTPDPRIEAVAKLLFTGPLWGFNADSWNQHSNRSIRADCLMAAEDVLRGIDEAAEWEYGIRTSSFINTAYQWTPWTREEVIAECKRRNDHDGRTGYSMTSVPFRRRPAGEPEPLP
jgi:hypothetical protein